MGCALFQVPGMAPCARDGAVMNTAADIEQLKAENETLRELVLSCRCPVDGRFFVFECQQCGCSVGLTIKDEERGT